MNLCSSFYFGFRLFSFSIRGFCVVRKTVCFEYIHPFPMNHFRFGSLCENCVILSRISWLFIIRHCVTLTFYLALKVGNKFVAMTNNYTLFAIPSHRIPQFHSFVPILRRLKDFANMTRNNVATTVPIISAPKDSFSHFQLFDYDRSKLCSPEDDHFAVRIYERVWKV